MDVDQSALTGESLPVTLREGDAAQMGATVVRGETHGIGTPPYECLLPDIGAAISLAIESYAVKVQASESTSVRG